MLKKRRKFINYEIEQLQEVVQKASDDIGVDLDEFQAAVRDGEIELLDEDDDEDGLNRDLLLELLPVGHSMLTKVAEPVPAVLFGSEQLKGLVDKMFYTMELNEGLGLAAPQVGHSLRVIIIQQDEVEAVR